MTKSLNGCIRCGTCCLNGGPALHHADLPLLRAGILPLHSLITLRRGELAHNPLTGKVQATKVELVKIAGCGRSWECRFYDSTKGCTIYDSRPEACRILKCWDPAESLALVEDNVLSRFDIIEDTNILLPDVKKHEEMCPCSDLELLLNNPGMLADAVIRDAFEKIIREDMVVRSEAVSQFGLTLPEELFYFGRPFFQLMRQLGVQFRETAKGLEIVA